MTRLAVEKEALKDQVPAACRTATAFTFNILTCSVLPGLAGSEYFCLQRGPSHRPQTTVPPGVSCMPESLLGTPYKEQARGRWPPEGVLADSRVSVPPKTFRCPLRIKPPGNQAQKARRLRKDRLLPEAPAAPPKDRLLPEGPAAAQGPPPPRGPSGAAQSSRVCGASRSPPRWIGGGFGRWCLRLRRPCLFAAGRACGWIWNGIALLLDVEALSHPRGLPATAKPVSARYCCICALSPWILCPLLCTAEGTAIHSLSKDGSARLINVFFLLAYF
ncbi:uncharacterized protein LOC110261413 [Sus scrofa]|uniref:uncharacterized protein LOC110261413 n=1 Tax=Sus scrofa TaxID=9823 RepID=UPI000A2AEFC6|nr:uncharacterized protein LOC110261413 [Sus scrofa]